MVVGHVCCQLCHTKHRVQVIVKPAHGGHPHAAAVAAAVVGLRIVAEHPSAAVAAVGIVPADGLHGMHQLRTDDVIIVLQIHLHQRIRHGQGHDGVVGEGGTAAEQGEVLALAVVGIELVSRPDDISQNRSKHNQFSFPFLYGPMLPRWNMPMVNLAFTNYSLRIRRPSVCDTPAGRHHRGSRCRRS